MSSDLYKAMRADLRRMDDAACDLSMEHRVSLGRVLYWVSVALLHVLTWIIREEDRRRAADRD